LNVVMINDCSHVGETILKYLPAYFDRTHIRRGRNLWDKTFGLAHKILRAKGDAYHVHYLLQDCYLALKFGKHPVIGHAHGSDLRVGLNHRVWNRIVKYNLKHCEKILVSTPDILKIAKKLREDAEYIPNPVDTSIFYPKPVNSHNGRLKVLIAANCNWKVKGTDIAIYALSRLKSEVDAYIIRYGRDFAKTLALADSLGLSLNVLPKTSHQEIREYYWNADVVLGSFGAGALGMVALEAIACGRPVITYVSSRYPEYHDFPLRDVNTADKILEAIEKTSHKLWKAEYGYLKKYHSPEKAVKRIYELYFELCGS